MVKKGDFFMIEPDVENQGIESVRLRRALGDLVVSPDVSAVGAQRAGEWRNVRRSLIHAALAEGPELAA